MTTEQEQLYVLMESYASLCEQHNLNYFLAGGTLLGAVRHNGFIPWDDDIDIAMPLEDFQKFMCLKDALPEGLAIQSSETDPDYPFLFGKLCNTKIPFETNKTYGPMGIYIDIFPLIPSIPYGKKSAFIFHVIAVIGYVLQVKTGWCDYIPYKKRVARWGFQVLNCFPTSWLKCFRQCLVSMIYDKGSQETLCSPGGIYKADKEFFPKSWFAKTDKMLFERKEFPSPIGWDCYLERNYGNYMELPPQEEQHPRHRE